MRERTIEIPGGTELGEGDARDRADGGNTGDDAGLATPQGWFAEAIESITDSFVVYDGAWRFKYVNRKSEAIIGRPRAELLGRNVWELYPEAVGSRYYEALHRALENHASVSFVEYFPAFDTWFDVRAYPTPEGLAVYHQDITERKRAEHALRMSEQRFRLLTENASDIISVLDGAATILYESPSIERTLGYAPSDLVGKNAFDFLHPDDVEGVRVAFEGELAQPNGASRVEYRFRHADGSWRVLESVGQNLLADPAVAGIVINSRDITERRRAEDDLRRTDEQRRHSQKMEAVGQLAGGIAHHFNNLLTIITGYSALMLARLEPDDPTRREAEAIATAADRASQLTRQLLTFSRKPTARVETIDLNALVSDLRPMLAQLAGDAVSLVADLDMRLGPIEADREQIEQVIVNLVVNARDAMARGGGRLVLATASRDVDAAEAKRHPGLEPGSYVLLTVSDTGVGMDDATRAHIFEPFFTTKEVGQGTGLGLSSVYEIVRQRRGHIEVESEPGHGATFVLYFPKSDAEAARPRARRESLEAAGSETVLLVEDEEGVRELAGETMRRAGYTVVPAPHGAAALEEARALGESFDLLVTDVVMPGMGGPELAAALRRSRPALRVLFISGYSEDPALRADALGVTDYLQKPFTPDALLEAVRDLLDRE